MSILDDVEFEGSLFQIQLWLSKRSIVHSGGLRCDPSDSKLVYRNFDLEGRLRFRCLRFYQMSEDEVVEFLVEGNTTSDNHFMKFLDLLKAIWYPIFIILSTIRRVLIPVLSR